MNRKKAFSLALTAVLAALFFYSALFCKNTIVWCVMAPITALLFGKLLWQFGQDFVSDINGGTRPANLRPKEPCFKSNSFKVLICLIVFRLFVFFIGYIMQQAMGPTDLLGSFNIWTKSGDTRSYLGIAQNWYVTEGDPRFHIVFFPFYPILIKIFSFIGGYLASGIFVSNVSAILGGYVLYKLIRLETDEKTAMRAAKYYFILPAAFFLTAPMSDSLAFLLSVLCMYSIRRRKFFLAGICGMFAAFTRSLGGMMVVPFFIEWVIYFFEQEKGQRIKNSWKKALCVFLIPVGLLLYLLINKLVTGNALQFMIYQKEHWHQGFGFFYNTTSYQMEYLINSEFDQKIALWLPNLIYIFSSLIIVGAAQKRMRASYTGYFLAYFVIAIGVTWLLSGPRYLTCVFTLPYALSELTRSKTADTIATFICIVLFIIYLAFYALGYPVY